MINISKMLRRANRSSLGLLVAVATAAPYALAQEDAWDTAGFVENATYYRDGPGLSKVRNTAQFEFTKNFGKRFGLSNFRVSGTLRGTYDAVYDLNDDEWGDNAGGSRSFENFASSNAEIIYGGTDSPWGQSILSTGAGPGFGFDLGRNPNQGLKVLGEDFHNPNGGVTLGVPVRPCDKDNRGCGLDDYLNYSSNDLRFPEFNDRLDFIRELYFEGSIPTGDVSELFLRVGKQQVVWGRTDLFRVLDIINPVDYSRHNIYDELEDIRIPQWIASAEYRWGAVGPFDDMNLQLVWNFDEFRPSNLGQGGSPYAILDAGSFFRAMNTCWEYGCTASNFVPAAALVAAGAPLPDPTDPGLVAADFAPGVIGIRDVNLPSGHDQGGIKLEGVYKSLGFSLNYYHFYQQLPVLRGDIPSMNPFTGVVADWDYLIAFDIDFPEVDLFGGSLDFYVDSLKSVFRVEATYTTGEEVANSLEPDLYSDTDMFRWVLGWDRNTWIRPLNKTKAFLLSAQVFGEHILDYQLEKGPLGDVGMPNWEDNYIFTFLIKGWWMNDLLSPQILAAYDYEAEAGVVAPSVDWLINDNWRLMVGFNVKFGNGMKDQKFDDCRGCNPFPPYTATPAHADPLQAGSVGIGGIEPLGRFRSGPIGSASKEDEFQITLRYRF